MKLSNFMQGLEILKQYAESEYCLAAEHDIFYVNATKPMSPEHVRELAELGWFQEGIAASCGEDSFRAGLYEPGESWAAFT